MEGEALKKKIVAAEVILWVTALVANINWGGFFWCFSLMIIGYLAFLAVDAEEKRKKTEAEKAEKKKALRAVTLAIRSLFPAVYRKF